jgi:hypothetical protein
MAETPQIIGAIVLAAMGAFFFLLQEPEIVPGMGYVKQYLFALFRGWAVSMSTVASLVFLFLPIVLPGKFRDSSAVSAGYIWIAAAVCFLVANFLVWKHEHVVLENELTKNQAAPKIQISALNTISSGKLTLGLTDLFVYLELVLESPSRVSISDFSLMVFSASASRTLPACEDIPEWELKKWDGNNLFVVQCSPLVKDLPQRGDPIQGWIHFPLPGIAEGSIDSYGWRVKINSAHGTCYYTLDSNYVHPSKRGSMRKIHR